MQTAFSHSQESCLPPSLYVSLLLSALFIFLLKLLMIRDIPSEKWKSIDIYRRKVTSHIILLQITVKLSGMHIFPGLFHCVRMQLYTLFGKVY